METVSIRLALPQLRRIAEALQEKAARERETSELAERLMQLYRARMEDVINRGGKPRPASAEDVYEHLKRVFGG